MIRVDLKNTWDATCSVEFVYKSVRIVGCWSTQYGYEFDETEWLKTGLPLVDKLKLLAELKGYPKPEVRFAWGSTYDGGAV